MTTSHSARRGSVRAGRGHEGGAERQGELATHWIVSGGVVAAVGAAFLYLCWVSALSSVIAGVSTLASRQDSPATSLAASPRNAPANASAESSKKQPLEVARADANPGGAASTTGRANASFFKQFEAQVAAVQAIDADPYRIEHQAGAVAPDTRNGRTRHGRRH